MPLEQVHRKLAIGSYTFGLDRRELEDNLDVIFLDLNQKTFIQFSFNP